MKQLIILIGPPGSGKTQYCQTLPNAIRINQDEQGRDNHYSLFINAIKANNELIIVDRMNFSIEQRRKYYTLAKESGYNIKYVIFYVPKLVCQYRCELRQNHPTITDRKSADKAISFFFKKFEYPNKEIEQYNEIEEIRYHFPKKLTTYICDLDNTLCDNSHRQHFVNCEGKKNWKAFFDGISEDKLNEPLRNLLTLLEDKLDIFLFVSGRPDVYKDVTNTWLLNIGKFHNYQYKLYMRARDDFRPDSLVKEIILDFELFPRYNILGAFDDRNCVVEMFRRRGIFTMAVANGNF